MLVLSRKRGEQIVINGDVVVTVNSISPSRVCLGIIASPEVTVRRSELMPRDTDIATPLLSGGNRGDLVDAFVWSGTDGLTEPPEPLSEA
jgi:carbon storage regulator CsrA